MKIFDVFTKMSQDEFKTQILPILREVFNYPGSFLEVFGAKLSFRIADVHFGVLPDKEIFDAFRHIGLNDGYNGCYYVFIDHDSEPPFNIRLQDELDGQVVDCWYLPFKELEKAEKVFCPYCQAFISPQGDWGIFVTRDNFLVLGSTPEVGIKLRTLIPEIDKSIYRFLEFEKKSSAPGGGIPALIRHLYGNKYDSLLREYDFIIPKN